MFSKYATELRHLFALIDYDWAANKGSAKYPLWMNPEIAWPSGAAPGQLITKVHDTYWLVKLQQSAS